MVRDPAFCAVVVADLPQAVRPGMTIVRPTHVHAVRPTLLLQTPGRSLDPGTVARVSQEGWQPYNSRAKVARPPRAKITMASLSEADLQTRPQEMVSRADRMQGEADEAEAAIANW
jgi:hypothetical protein